MHNSFRVGFEKLGYKTTPEAVLATAAVLGALGAGGGAATADPYVGESRGVSALRGLGAGVGATLGGAAFGAMSRNAGIPGLLVGGMGGYGLTKLVGPKHQYEKQE